MWKYALSFALLIAFGALLFPRNEGAPRIASLSPQEELKVKQATLSQDMKLTDDLCRTQCSLELRRVLNVSEGAPLEKKQQELVALQQQHPHMEQLIWTQRSQTVDKGIQAGSLPDALRTMTEPKLREAKQKTDRGESYQSLPFQFDGDTYFVLGVPSNSSETALLGVVKQSILKHVENHQLKNLRIVTYPADNHYKIESVDSRTLRDVKVRHPEENEGTSHYHVNQVVVRFNQEPTQADLAKIDSEIGTSHYRKIGYTYIFESKQMEAKQLMNYFKKWNVAYAEPHFLYLTNSEAVDSAVNADTARKEAQISDELKPNDTLYQRYQWNLPNIETEQGWTISKGSDQIKVAIVDTGVDINHPDLKDQLISGYNVVNTDAAPLDDVGHGTHVAGVIGAVVNNNIGVAGMSWYNRIMPVKVLDQSGAGSTYSVAQGIIWATDHGAKVINMSLGNYADANFLHDAIKYAYDHDVVLIAASGNDNTETPGYPAAYPEVFAVAATDSNKNKASFSNYGDYVDAAAPGVSIASTYPHNQYAALSGTSMASPHVTALAALIRSVNPDLKNTEVMQIMRETAQDIGPKGKDKYYGHGLIDVVAALKRAEATKNPQSMQSPQQPEPVSTLPEWTQRLLDRLWGR
ncbi:Thermophilic serine proteinase precursor [Paenibacillus konkukensis]|uniref:Thermophilic serine proteinase n=1 Tax=Paenibacillus konkukensis TaxID=2020716 RepID=A0ABY4S0M9_9BACL|nr:S8 family peptidase [Paenibacillus konkukensis]UQZ87014.1 Thermophilic serine proteinase precursor [Paenibacillus konkukensis]